MKRILILLLLSTTSVSASPRAHYENLATSAASLCGVPKEIFFELINTESLWRQYEKRGKVLESSSGALGLGQIKVSSAREVSENLNIFEPWGNLLAASCFLRRQYDRFGSWRLALYSYNAGSKNVIEKNIKPFTVKYARRILGEMP